MSAPEPMAFVAVKPCGHLAWASVDDPTIGGDFVREQATEMARCVRAGYTILRVTCEEVRTGPRRMCDCPRRPADPQRGLFAEVV